jgi:undecaprenyl-diphosphatase
VMIQLGAVLAVAWLYRAKLTKVVLGLPSDPDARRFALMIALACVPAIVTGALLNNFIKSVLYYRPDVIATAFVVGGVIMLAVERYRPTPDVADAERMSLGRAISVGAFQAIAIIPGVSRSGATIVGGMVLGLDRAAAAEFSFFLAMPTMTAAFVYDLVNVRDHLTPDRTAEIAIGFVMAFIAALVVVKPFLRFVARSGFAPFAWYRIALGLLIFGAMGAGWL